MATQHCYHRTVLQSIVQDGEVQALGAQLLVTDIDRLQNAAMCPLKFAMHRPRKARSTRYHRN